MMYKNIDGVPKFQVHEFKPKSTKYCLCIPLINESDRIITELKRANDANIHKACDIIICDGDSTDKCTDTTTLKQLNVNSLLIKKDTGKQAAQLRMGIWWALQRGYEGIITIDGNNKDSIEDVPSFIEKLDGGYDFVQGSRYVEGGMGINTPLARHLAVRLIHAPFISHIAKEKFTDTTNAFRGYSKKYLSHPKVLPLRDIFVSYELLAYLSVMASKLGLNTCEIPVKRQYPKAEKTPTKISPIKGNINLLNTLFRLSRGEFDPK